MTPAVMTELGIPEMIKLTTSIVVVGLALVLSSAPRAAEYFVKMKFDEDAGKVYFEPRRIDVKLGDIVTWVQQDTDNEHNVVSYPNGIPKGAELFQSRMMKNKGDSWSMKFDRPGTYNYHCHPHEAVGMKGMVVVERESTPEEMRSSRPGEHMHSGGGHGKPAMGHDEKPDAHGMAAKPAHKTDGHGH